LVDMRSLYPILLAVGLVSVGYGYLRAYTGPFFPVILRDAGYSAEAIGSILVALGWFWTISGFGILALITLVSYRYGSRYRLTLLSGFVFIVLVYLTELVGNFVGTAIYQIQVLRYPILSVSLLNIVASYGYVEFALIGVLTANYVREVRQKQMPQQG